MSCSNIIGSDKVFTSSPFKIADTRRCFTVRLNGDNFYTSFRPIECYKGLAVTRRMMNNFTALRLNTRKKCTG